MSRPQKRSFQIRGHRTSLSLEEPFWEALREISATQGKPLAGLVAEIDASRDAMASGLSSAIRVYILNYYRSSPTKTPGSATTKSHHDELIAEIDDQSPPKI